MSTAAKWISTLLLPTSATALGRLVGDILDPSDNFQDTSLSEEFPNGPEPASSDIEARNVRYDNIRDKRWGLSIALTTIFSSTLAVKENDVSKIIADSLTTRKLSNPSRYFLHACQNDTVREWLERRWRRRRKAYMVTGTMSLLNPQVTLNRGVVLEAGQGVGMPGSVMLLAATQGTVPTLGGMESMLDSNIAVSRGVERSVASSLTFTGETILAIQYRQVDFSWFHKPSPTSMCLSTRPEWKTYLGSRGGHLDFSSDEEDTQEDDEDDDTVTLQAIVGGGISTSDLGEFHTHQTYDLDHAEEIWVVS
ncbi:hypothetical protein F5Y08DRAFT_302798 [Xylaria arbuscula]|uniref:Uncharacterized protein n=1 Tax=Xylaria arbuscula TaxID=114810 RepID=A0A9W8TL77_9PEZI|nr:hypothetical protein F5Y08DRAFT_302798 [Xylaria arbuscula]KAJ3571029.1 hypothetical protein NPX13_g5525 [Xylaria arbuscula]